MQGGAERGLPAQNTLSLPYGPWPAGEAALGFPRYIARRPSNRDWMQQEVLALPCRATTLDFLHLAVGEAECKLPFGHASEVVEPSA